MIKKKRANICATRFRDINGSWKVMYDTVIMALRKLDYDVAISNHMKIGSGKYHKDIIRGLDGESPQNDLFVYNHTYKRDLINKDLYRSNNTLYLKPTGPTPYHYTIDTCYTII